MKPFTFKGLFSCLLSVPLAFGTVTSQIPVLASSETEEIETKSLDVSFRVSGRDDEKFPVGSNVTWIMNIQGGSQNQQFDKAVITLTYGDKDKTLINPVSHLTPSVQQQGEGIEITFNADQMLDSKDLKDLYISTVLQVNTETAANHAQLDNQAVITLYKGEEAVARITKTSSAALMPSVNNTIVTDFTWVNQTSDSIWKKGDIIELGLEIRNAGEEALQDSSITFGLNTDVELSSIDSPGNSVSAEVLGRDVKVNLNELGGHTSAWIQLKHVLTNEDLMAAQNNNDYFVILISAKDPVGIELGKSHIQDTVTLLLQSVSIGLSQSAPDEVPAKSGTEVPITMLITNDQDQDITGPVSLQMTLQISSVTYDALITGSHETTLQGELKVLESGDFKRELILLDENTVLKKGDQIKVTGLYTITDQDIENGKIISTVKVSAHDTYDPDWIHEKTDTLTIPLVIQEEQQKPAPSEPDKPSRPEEPEFLDTENHVAYIVGRKSGNIEPNATLTRDETVTIFYRLLLDSVRNEYWTNQSPYNDVFNDDWCSPQIATLSALKIIKGYEDGSFRPAQSITRAEFAKIAASFFGDGFQELSSTPKFTDIQDHWAKRDIEKAYRLGLIVGYSDNIQQQ